MGIRSNVGNITTNAIQTLAISGTTASRVFRDRADSALNNLSKEEQSKYYKMKADKMRKEMTDFYSQDEKAKTDPKTYTKYTEEQAKDIGEATVKSRSDWAKSVLGKEDDVDFLMEDEIKLAPETEEGNNINTYVNNNVSFLEDFLAPEEKIQELIDKGEV